MHKLFIDCDLVDTISRSLYEVVAATLHGDWIHATCKGGFVVIFHVDNPTMVSL